MKSQKILNSLSSESKLKNLSKLIKDSIEIKKENPQMSEIECRILAKEKDKEIKE